MKKLIVKDKWEYEVTKNEGQGIKGYGYKLKVFKNDILVFENGAFGSETIAEINMRQYFLSNEFNIEPEY